MHNRISDSAVAGRGIPLSSSGLASGHVQPIEALTRASVSGFDGLALNACAAGRAVTIADDGESLYLPDLVEGAEYFIGLAGPVLLSALAYGDATRSLGKALGGNLQLVTGDVFVYGEASGEDVIGDLADLTTSDDATIVEAINEVDAAAGAAQGEIDTHEGLTTAHGSTSSNTASAIVQRDASGNFSAGTITAALTGVSSGNLTSFQGRSTQAATLSRADVTGTGLAPADIGAAPAGASFLTTQAESGLSAEANLGLLTTGLLKIAVALGVATPSTAAAGTDYQLPLTPVAVVSSPKTVGASEFVMVLKTTGTINLPAANVARLVILIADATSTGTIHPDGADTIYGVAADETMLPGDGAIFATTGNGDWVWL